MQLQPMKFSKATYLVNQEAGYFPYFSLIAKTRIAQKLALNIAVVGEPGTGKSYCGWTIGKILDSKFTIDQVVYTYPEYMSLLRRLSLGRPIVFDEPNYAMDKRDWYKQINKVLVQTMVSQRFLVHPVIIPVINMTLLDKTIRDHLLQYIIHVIKRTPPKLDEQDNLVTRGSLIANVYRLYASQWEEKTYHPFICQLRYPLLGKCPKDSCLGCRQLKTCPEFRAQYERKKAAIQDIRYEQAEGDASHFESQSYTDAQLAKMIYEYKSELVNDKGKLDQRLLRIVFQRKLNIAVGHNKAYTIVSMLKYDHPNEFP